MNTQIWAVEGKKTAGDPYQKLRGKLAGPNGDWWRLQLEKLRGGQLPAAGLFFPADVVARLLEEFERIAVDNRKVRLSELRRRHPGALLIDLTGQAREPWLRFSPLYPHGGIPVPYSPGYSSVCVEGIWQGLKVFENEDVAPDRFRATKDIVRPETTRRGKLLGFRAGVEGAVLPHYRGRLELLLPAYRWVLEHRLNDEVRLLRELVEQRPVVLLGHGSSDLENISEPFSHAALVAMFVRGRWPQNSFSGLFREQPTNRA